MPVLEGFQPFSIEAVDALAHGLTIKAHAGGNGRCDLAAAGVPDDLSALHQMGWSGAGVGQLHYCYVLFSTQIPYADRCHGPSPLLGMHEPQLYPFTCRMHH
jgi:hypothetical protein